MRYKADPLVKLGLIPDYTDDINSLGGVQNISSYWKPSNNGIKYAGHIAVGADADVDGLGPVNDFLQDFYGAQTISNVSSIQEIRTGAAKYYEYGLNTKHVANFTGNATMLFGINATTATAAGYAGNILIAAGIVPTFIHRGTGVITAAYGNNGFINNQSTGTISTANGMATQVFNSAGGTINSLRSVTAFAPSNSGTVNEAYGLYLEDHSGIGGVSSYNLYSLGGTSRNYMGGKLGIGTGSVHAEFGTNHRLIVGAASTLDNLARVQINSEAATDKPLVVQGYAAQTANLQDWQNSAGTVLSRINADGKVGVNTGANAAIARLDVRTPSGDYTVPMLNLHSDNATGVTKGWNFWIGGDGDYAGSLKIHAEGQPQDSWSLKLNSSAESYGVSSTYFFSAPSFNSAINGRGDSAILKWTNDGANSISGTADIGQSYASGGAPATFSRAKVWIGSTATSYFNVTRHTDVVDLFNINGATGNITPIDGANIVLGTTTGLKLGTATTQKLGFYNATPVIQQTSDVNALVTYGLLASISNMTFTKEVAATIKVADTTTAATAGAALAIAGGAGSPTTGGAGGIASVTGGAGQAGNSAGGAANIVGGVGFGVAAGGAVNITGGGGCYGWYYYY